VATWERDWPAGSGGWWWPAPCTPPSPTSRFWPIRPVLTSVPPCPEPGPWTSPAPMSGPSSTSTCGASGSLCWTGRRGATPRSRSVLRRQAPHRARHEPPRRSWYCARNAAELSTGASMAGPALANPPLAAPASAAPGCHLYWHEHHPARSRRICRPTPVTTKAGSAIAVRSRVYSAQLTFSIVRAAKIRAAGRPPPALAGAAGTPGAIAAATRPALWSTAPLPARYHGAAARSGAASFRLAARACPGEIPQRKTADSRIPRRRPRA
jgi:hypothetical protein